MSPLAQQPTLDAFAEPPPPPTTVLVYTDGGCDPNPGPGGWAALLQISPPAGGSIRLGVNRDQRVMVQDQMLQMSYRKIWGSHEYYAQNTPHNPRILTKYLFWGNWPV